MTFFAELETATAADRAALVGSPIVADALSGRVTRHQYVEFLRRAYHHVRHTPALLMACGSRLVDRQSWLQEKIAHYIEEEVGHHEWILDDIAAAGGDADAVRDGAPEFNTDVMVAYAYDTVLRRNPVGFFGMVYVLEGTSVSLATAVAARLQDALGLARDAFSYLTSHGALDVEHMGHFAGIVDRLDDDGDRASVLHSARAFFRLYGNVLRSIEREQAA